MPKFPGTWPNDASLARALSLARAAAAEPGLTFRERPRPERAERCVAIGDPQAPIERFFQVLLQHDLLDASGWLAPDVHLVSMGDHFDYGPFEMREAAALSGEQLLSWLCAHPPEQVTILAGNHDISRVGELAAFEGDEFAVASAAAHQLYRAAEPDPERERAFFERYPALPSIETAARDLSTFRPAQRQLVRRLLEQKRMRLAAEFDGVLYCHAGVTREHLDAIGVPSPAQSDASAVCAALNASLDAALQSWQTRAERPLQIPGLHRAGSHQTGEAGGILVHRPARVAHEPSPDLFSRRYDPRRLPRGLIQVTGHVRDPKSRTLLREWVSDGPAPEGELRSLTVDAEQVEYRRGVPRRHAGTTAMVFTDGAMASTPPERYQVLNLKSLAPLRG